MRGISAPEHRWWQARPSAHSIKKVLTCVSTFCIEQEPTIWNWVRQIALALRDIHDKLLVHMDTKVGC